MGARIDGLGTGRLRIQGVGALHAPKLPHPIIPDRIETGTFLCAVAAAGGDVTLRRTRADHLDTVLDKLREAGVQLECGATGSACAPRAARRR
jgi:UDP-N-acetylglucosamine 1-carboxyvinyltransferase